MAEIFWYSFQTFYKIFQKLKKFKERFWAFLKAKKNFETIDEIFWKILRQCMRNFVNILKKSCENFEKLFEIFEKVFKHSLCHLSKLKDKYKILSYEEKPQTFFLNVMQFVDLKTFQNREFWVDLLKIWGQTTPKIFSTYHIVSSHYWKFLRISSKIV